MFLEAVPKAYVPLSAFVTPSEDPVALYSNVTSGFIAENSSPVASIIFFVEVDPPPTISPVIAAVSPVFSVSVVSVSP